ncbi:MAG: hypothetical protein WCF23_16075 [Candidatus Nitrosopolaris sp.]
MRMPPSPVHEAPIICGLKLGALLALAELEEGTLCLILRDVKVVPG